MTGELDLKERVRTFWDAESCGEVYAAGESAAEYYRRQRDQRYRLEPYIFDFARFPSGEGRDVLEIGVGMGADHVEWARSRPRSLVGVDLTPRAVGHTRRRLKLCDLESDVRVADAESLPFADRSFDLVYSWGVLHHSPDPPAAVAEVRRVLRDGGQARIMLYHRHSLAGAMLWLRYGLTRGRPWRSLASIFAEHVESPGTRAYSVREAREMFAGFTQVRIDVELSFADLLLGAAGQRHRGMLLTVARKLWPRWLVRRWGRRWGLMLLVEATR